MTITATNLLLKYPSRLSHQAIRCLAVAKLVGVNIETKISEESSLLTLHGPPVKFVGPTAICTYITNIKGDISLLDNTKLIQWTDFADSEVRCYQPGSFQMRRSLEYLEKVLQCSQFLRGDELTACDLLVGSTVLSLVSGVHDLPFLASWLSKVQKEVQVLTNHQLTPCPKNVQTSKSKKTSNKSKNSVKLPVSPSPRKLRLLCIHGYRQSGKTFKEKLGSFRKLVSKQAELEFMTAPHLVPGEEEADQFGWWFSQDNCTFDAHESATCDRGFSESLAAVEKVASTAEQPFDGLFCFSQGAAFGAHICMLQQTGRLGFNFRFCILVAGFMSRSLQHKIQFEDMSKSQKIEIPTLHVFGDTDKVIESDMSEELVEYFSNSKVVRHTGGHYVPATGDNKKCFTDFLTEMQNIIC